jgi:hypothetical protein
MNIACFLFSFSFRTFLQNFPQTPYVTSKIYFLLINDCYSRKTGSVVRMENKTITRTNVKFSAINLLGNSPSSFPGTHNNARRTQTTGIVTDDGCPVTF